MDQRDVWGDLVADAWVRNAPILDEHSAPFGRAAMDRLGSVSAQRVLDIGCGTGATTRELAQRGAAVVGIDLSERMADHARSLAAGDPGVEHRVGTVEELEPDEPFDALFSRFGVMFFDDPVAAFAHLRSIVRPGGRFAYAAWNEVGENPWMFTPVLATIPILGVPEMLGPDQPGPFALAPPDRSCEVLEAAGWSDVEIEVLTLERPYPAPSVEATATTLMEDNPPIADGLRRQPERRDEVRAAIIEALEPLVQDSRVVFRSSALIASARA